MFIRIAKVWTNFTCSIANHFAHESFENSLQNKKHRQLLMHFNMFILFLYMCKTYLLLPVLMQADLCLAWSETPKTDFLAVKFLNFGSSEIFAVINLKFKQRGQI